MESSRLPRGRPTFVPGPWSHSVPRGASLVAPTIKNLPEVQESQVPSLGWEDPLEKECLPTPVFLPGDSKGREPGGLQSTGSQRAGQDWVPTTTTQQYNSQLQGQRKCIWSQQFGRERHQCGQEAEGLFSFLHFTYPITKRCILSFMKTQMSSLKADLAQEPEVPFSSSKIKSHSHHLVLLTYMFILCLTHWIINTLKVRTLIGFKSPLYSQHWEQCLASVVVQ